MASFYGWDEESILGLTPNKFWAYSREIEPLHAEEQLRLINAINFPNLQLKDKRRIIREYQKISDPFYKERQQKSAEMTMKSLQAKFGYKGKR